MIFYLIILLKKFKMKTCSLQIGDVLFYKNGTGLLSRIIRWGTNSPYSHVLMYIGNGKCIESDFSLRKIFFEKKYQSGVKILSLHQLRKRRGSHDIFRSCFFFSSLKKNALALAEKEFKYDFIGLLWRAVLAGKWKFFRKKSFILLHNKNKYYCSELVHRLYIMSGLNDEILPEETTPESESKRKDLFFIGNLCKNIA